jgi:hypothetical protein
MYFVAWLGGVWVLLARRMAWSYCGTLHMQDAVGDRVLLPSLDPAAPVGSDACLSIIVDAMRT